MIPAQAFDGSALQQDYWITSGVMLRRVLAWMLDAVLVGLLVLGAWLFCLMFGLLTLGIGWPLFGLLPALPVLYHWLFLASFAATPGQGMMGLTVRRDPDLLRPDPLESLAFTLLFYLTMICGMFWFAIALFTPRHRALHDIVSGLVVVRVRALTPPARPWNMGMGNVPPGGSTAA
jgi:uncharacterized RDD family membrane protein YckC